jgi:hypothetical protein
MTRDARTVSALRRLLASGAWLWLVRPGAGDEAAALCLLLLHALPGLLDAFGAELARRG